MPVLSLVLGLAASTSSLLKANCHVSATELGLPCCEKPSHVEKIGRMRPRMGKKKPHGDTSRYQQSAPAQFRLSLDASK